MFSLLFAGIMAFNVNAAAAYRGAGSDQGQYNVMPSKESVDGDEFDGLDGKVFHCVFHRFKDQNGIDKARDYCSDFNAAIKDKKLNAVSAHCGIQNSKEDFSFGRGMKLDKSLEYGIVLTFRTLEDKLDVTQNNALYHAFRDELHKLRDTEYGDDDFDGVYVTDFIHGQRDRTNGRPPTSANGPRILPSGSLYHFVFVRYDTRETTVGAVPFLVDMLRDLKLNSVDPRDDRALFTSMIWGQINTEEKLGFKPKDKLGLDHAFSPTFNNELDRDIFVGKIGDKIPKNIKYIGYDFANDAFKHIISEYLDDLFVFDFTNEACSM